VGCVGNYNFVNPGALSHNQILELYKHYVDPTFIYENFSEKEQNKILKVGRAHCELDTNKLLKIFPDISHIKEAIITVFEQYKKSL